MRPPDRFGSATFETYEASTPSQADALDAVRRFVRACRHPPSLLDRLKRFVGATPPADPPGIYLVGPAGTGKTHLLAAAYHALTPEVSCAFVHSSTFFRRTEPPKQLGHAMADQYEVCCLDEVEIDDPANEMRLVQLLNTLDERDVPLLATSNVEPEEYMSSHFNAGRFQQFLHKEFRERYQIVFVGGDDYRQSRDLQRMGKGWIGPPDRTRAAMQQVFSDTVGSSRWCTFDDLRHASTEMAHPRLIDTLTSVDHLFIESVEIPNSDDALRLLRVIDALYLHEDAPILYFTSEVPPETWFDPDPQEGVARAVAEKFERTVSRLHALCSIRESTTKTTASSDAYPSE